MNDASDRTHGGGRINLAREPPFSLGSAVAHPAEGEVRVGADRIRLQPRVMQVLVALARARGEAVSRDDLVESCWGGLAVGDDAINRCIQRLRRLEKETTGAFSIETLPRMGYRLTPSEDRGALEPSESPEAMPGTAAPRVRWVRLIAAGAALVLIVLGGLWLWRGRSVPAPHHAAFPTVAITAFQPADGAPEANAFAATLTDEVSDAASGYDLVVVKPTPAKGLAGTPPTDFLLNGRVLRKGNQLSATSELVDARQGVVVYSFDTPLASGAPSDAASIIAARLAHALDPSKFTNDLGGKLSASDYTLIARANEAIDQVDMPEVLQLNQALAQRYPNDGDLQAAIAITALVDLSASPPVDRPELLRLARRSVAEAERLNPRSGLLYVARQSLLNGPMSYRRQEHEARRAIELEPNLHVAYVGLGDLMVVVGRSTAGVGLLRRAVELDPMSRVVVVNAIYGFVEVGAKDQAERALARFETLWPRDPAARNVKILVALYLGQPKDVLEILANSPPPAAGAPPAERKALMRAISTHDRTLVREMVNQCFANHGSVAGQGINAICLLEMVQDGALDDAFRFSELTYPDHRDLYPPDADGWLLNPPPDLDPGWLFGPRMKPFRDDPRFWDVALRTGLVDYWLSTGAWPDDCEGRIADCKRLAAAAEARAPAPHRVS